VRKIVILAAVQIGFILAWAGYHERVRAYAPTFRIPLAPVDPHDILRGRYFILNPRDGSMKTGQGDTLLTKDAVEGFLAHGERHFEGPALIGFCPAAEVHRVCALRRPGVLYRHSGPAGSLWATGRATVSDEPTVYRDTKEVPEPGWRVELDLGLDRFFLPDAFQLPGREADPSWQLEVSHRPGLPLLPSRLWFQGQPVRIED